MSYREKTAWLTLGCLVVAYGVYFSLIASRAPGTMLGIIILFGSIATVQAVTVIIGSVALAVRTTPAARVSDERDRAIARRGATIAYFVLLTGLILVGVVMPFTETPWKIVNTALLALVVAEGVRYAIIVASYRRGWDG